MGAHIIRDILLLFPALLVSCIAEKRKALTRPGAIAAFSVSILLFWLGGFLSYITLAAFFLSSTLISKLRSADKKASVARIHKKHGTRDAVQVLANSLAALMMALGYKITGNNGFLLAACSAFAACNADTWASEIGLLSSTAPVSIITFKPVVKGLSGGVTCLGLLASLLGSFFISVIYFLFKFNEIDASRLLLHILLITSAGFAGSVLDSILGDLLQAKYKSHQTGDLTEKPYENGKANMLVRGCAVVTNDLVNFLSSLAPAVAVALLNA
jgi:uncharacterized protein (TIGR00297 family)